MTLRSAATVLIFNAVVVKRDALGQSVEMICCRRSPSQGLAVLDLWGSGFRVVFIGLVYK